MNKFFKQKASILKFLLNLKCGRVSVGLRTAGSGFSTGQNIRKVKIMLFR